MNVVLVVVLIALIGFFTWLAACSADTPYEDRQRIREDIRDWRGHR